MGEQTIISFSLFSLCLFGVLTLIIGSAGTDEAGKKNAGAATGVLNASQYVGSSAGSFFIGFIVEETGWNSWVLSLLPASLIAAASMVWLTASTWVPAPVEEPLPRRFDGAVGSAAAAEIALPDVIINATVATKET